MTETPHHVLAIDLGTSGPKIALVSADGKLRGLAQARTPLLLEEPGAAEQRPVDWWRAIKEATGALHAQRLADPNSIKAVIVTAQWAGTVPVDRDGAALRNAIIWMDTRGSPYVRKLMGGPLAIEGYGLPKLVRWLRRSGGAPSLGGKEPVAHILYLRKQHPEIFRRTYKFLEPKDYINLRLTGRFAASYDSIALHWVTDNRDIRAIRYDERLLAMSTLPRDKLPELREATDILGTITAQTATELGVPEHTKVLMGTPDVQSAAIGSGAVRDYEAHVYIGTSAWVTCHVPFKKTDVFHNMASLPAALPGRYFVACAQETAGACIEWLRDNLLYPDDGFRDGGAPDAFFERLEQTVSSAPPGSRGVLFTPWLFGERCPVADPHLRAAFSNLSLSSTRADLCRAVMEGVAYNLRWLLTNQEKFVGRRLDPLRFVGGGASSPTWCQILADVLDREILRVKDPVHCNARGAGLLASLGLGSMTVDEIAAAVPVAATYQPRQQFRGLYDDLYAAFMRFYRSNRRVYVLLNRGMRP